MSHALSAFCLHTCRAKLESALRSTQAQREGLDRRVLEQERSIEARLDSVEAALQVGAAVRGEMVSVLKAGLGGAGAGAVS